MGLPVEVNPLFLENQYAIQRSLRFRSSASAYLSRTPASASNRTTWTWSGWVKRGTLGSSSFLFSAVSGTTECNFYFTPTNALYFLVYNAGATVGQITTNAVFRDVSSWYHVVAVLDSSNATSSDRMRLYVNGVRQSVDGTTVTIGSGVTGQINNNVPHYTGSYNGSLYFFDGYMAEVNFIDGLALTPSSFGQYNEFGVWSPRKYGGSYGTNGFYLPFNDPTSATTLCYDRQLGYTDTSKNNWTPNNISTTAGPTYDAMTDVPPPSTIQNVRAGNYATLNPLSNGTNLVCANANLSVSNSVAESNHRMSRATIGVTSGKFYWEVNVNNSAYIDIVGVAALDSLPNGYVGGTGASAGWGYSTTTGSYYPGTGWASSGTASAFPSSGIIGVAIDVTSGKMWVSSNGTWATAAGGVGDPANGTNPTFTYTGSSTTFFPAVSIYNNTGSWVFNLGQRPFSYTPPSGFVPLNSNNLPAPTIPNGAKVMAATTYTGTGSTQPITNGGNNTLGTTFQPDFVWIKNRGAAWNNNLYDVIRGTGKALYSDLTDAENTNSIYGYLSAFSASGFSATAGTTSGNLTNQSSSTYVAWQWNAGSGSSTIPSGGSITPTGASINVSAGFSVITYTAPVGTSTDTIPHGLGVAPSFIIVKCRVTSAVYNSWGVYHSSLGATKYLELNTTGAAGTASTWWNNTAPTASVFSVGSQFLEDNSTYVAYCWTPIAGYSSMGSYTGNGSTDGPFIYTGFRPRWIMIKSVGDTSVPSYDSWKIIDTSRSPYNALNPPPLWANANYQEGLRGNGSVNTASIYENILSNGFKLATGASYEVETNESGVTYIYVAFAENPFKYALAR